MNLGFRLLSSLVCCVLVLPAAAKSQANDYLSVLEQFVSDNAIAGGVLAVVGTDMDIVVKTGFSESVTRRPVTGSTRFYIASTGKMMVAAAILALVERGKLDLDGKVWPLISDLPDIELLEGADVVTLRQLLNHTSGLADYLGEDFAEASVGEPEKVWSEADAIRFAFGEPAYGSPGTVFEYSNSNYVLLGHVLKRHYPDLQAALSRMVFEPSGMRSTTVGATRGASDLAHGYATEQFDADVSAQSWASVLGDGPVVSTARDVAAFMLALLRDEKTVGSELIEEMLRGSEQDESYGLGIVIGSDEWGDWYGHSGGYDGFEADVRYYPDADLVLAFTVNGDVSSDADLLDQVAEIYFSN
ncbi:serine hydrolase domain-containing protein [Hoeflea sp.]|uniref:serine hydrolase domain-containing protein n=1 Tax=Hoeflea sp. TaxID=1940281 RepID=UPI003747A1F8